MDEDAPFCFFLSGEQWGVQRFETPLFQVQFLAPLLAGSEQENLVCSWLMVAAAPYHRVLRSTPAIFL